MRLLVRCDGAPAVGMGHVVRSCALAAALSSDGTGVEFVMRSERTAGIQAVREAGFFVHEIAEEAQVVELSDAYQAVLIDNYEVTSELLARIAARTRLAVIDDEGRRDLRSAHWLLNQNLGAEELAHHIAPGAVQLLGPRYALLRAEFASARARTNRRFTPRDCRVLITFGGGEVMRYLQPAVAALEAVNGRLEIVVLGAEDVRVGSRHDIRCVRVQNGVAGLMAGCDIAVTAAGTTCWELCCMKVPGFAIPIAQNQLIVARGLERAGALCVYRSFEDALSALAADVAALLSDPQERAHLSNRAGELVDGLGAYRAAESLRSLMATA